MHLLHRFLVDHTDLSRGFVDGTGKVDVLDAVFRDPDHARLAPDDELPGGRVELVDLASDATQWVDLVR